MKQITGKESAVAAMWATGAVVGARGLTFLGGIALARILAPEAFGLVGLALIFTSTVTLIQDLGYSKALLRDPGQEEPAASTSFMMILSIAAMLTAIIFVGAEKLASWSGGGLELARVLRLLSPLPLLHALGLIPITLLERRMDFRRLAWAEWLPAGAMMAVGIVAALAFRSVNALVLAYLTAAFVGSLAAFVLSRYRLCLRFDPETARSLFRFGRWVTLASLTGFIFLNADRFLIGRYLGSESVGIYLLAFSLANIPVTLITSVAGRVAFSAYAQLERENRSLGQAHLQGLTLLGWIAIPLCGLLGWLGPKYLPLVYGSRWIDAAPLLGILAVYGLFRTVGGLTGAAFLARNRSRLLLLVSLVQLTPIGFFLVSPPGRAADVALAFTASMAVSGLLALSISFRLTGLSQASGWNAFRPAVTAALAAAVVPWGAFALIGTQPIWESTALAGAALVIYTAIFLRSRNRRLVTDHLPFLRPARKTA